jgi:hypothetical protein
MAKMIAMVLKVDFKSVYVPRMTMFRTPHRMTTPNLPYKLVRSLLLLIAAEGLPYKVAWTPVSQIWMPLVAFICRYHLNDDLSIGFGTRQEVHAGWNQ